MCVGFFKARGGEARLGLEAESAGLFTSDGIPASENAVIAARERGADLSGHASRQLTPELAAGAKYLVCMTGAQYDRLTEQYPQFADKVFTLAPTDVSDPFGGSLTVYRHAAEQIDEAVGRLIEGLEKRV